MTIDCRKRSYINLIQRLGNGQILLDKMKKEKKKRTTNLIANGFGVTVKAFVSLLQRTAKAQRLRERLTLDFYHVALNLLQGHHQEAI